MIVFTSSLFIGHVFLRLSKYMYEEEGEVSSPRIEGGELEPETNQ